MQREQQRSYEDFQKNPVALGIPLAQVFRLVHRMAGIF